jgi:hypothetical protein
MGDPDAVAVITTGSPRTQRPVIGYLLTGATTAARPGLGRGDRRDRSLIGCTPHVFARHDGGVATFLRGRGLAAELAEVEAADFDVPMDVTKRGVLIRACLP